MSICQEAKEILQKVKTLDVLIESKRREISHLREKLYYKGLSYGEKISSSFQSDSREMMIATIIDYETELRKDVENLIELKKNIAVTIEKIKDADCIDVLYKRYFEFKTWDVIADEMHRVRRQVTRIHGKALYLFYKNYYECP